MNFSFEFFLALRYFKGKRKGAAFLSFIKIMAITGVAIGSAGLLIALSIVHGFKHAIDEKVMDFGAQLVIENFRNDPLVRADTLAPYLKKIDGILLVQPIVSGQVMIQSRDYVEGAVLRGIPGKDEVTFIANYLKSGKFSVDEVDGMQQAVLGAKLARSLHAEVGSFITLYALKGMPSADNLPEIKQFRVSGIYETGIDRFDDVQVIIHIDQARSLLDYIHRAATSVELKVASIDLIRPLEEMLNDILPYPYNTNSVYQTYSSIFAWIHLQEQTIPLVISVMVIVAAFNLIGTILMMILERTKDIGILKTMGARDNSVKMVFIFEGILVAATGLLIGIAFAVLFNYVQAEYKLIPLSQDNYYMTHAPVKPRLSDYVIVGMVTLGLCVLASWLPARVAARLNPLKVISFGR